MSQNFNMNIIGVLFYKNDANSTQMIRTIKTMVPHVYPLIMYKDISQMSPSQYPNIVKQHQTLPILVVKQLNQPIVGFSNIKKWIANQMEKSQDTRETRTQSGTTTPTSVSLKNSEELLDGFDPCEMGRMSSTYSYIDDKMSHNFSYENVESFYSPNKKTPTTASKQTKNAMFIEPSEKYESKSQKNDDISKKYDELVNDRNKIEIQCQNNTF